MLRSKWVGGLGVPGLKDGLGDLPRRGFRPTHQMMEVGSRVKMSVCCAWQVEWDDLARFVCMKRLFWSFGEKGMIVLEFSLSKQL